MNDTTVNGTLLVGEGPELRRIPDAAMRKALQHLPQHMAERLAFMTREHHLVRDFVVREIPRESRGLSACQIAAVTGITEQRVSAILEELERNLFFLVRNSRGEVNWAFPVTTERTAHRLSFSTGEKTYGA